VSGPCLVNVKGADLRQIVPAMDARTDEEDYWTGTPRFMACVMVDKYDLMSVLKGPPPHKYDTFTEQHVTLVSANRKEGSELVCLSSRVLHVYLLLGSCGWENVAEEEDASRP
jgi:hypothetical protein